MSLWVFQIPLDILLVVVSVLAIFSRKQLLLLEKEITLLKRELAIKEIRHETKALVPSSGKVPTGTLIEKKVEERSLTSERARSDRGHMDAYDRADAMMSRGHSLADISKQTGLSVAELQLLGKIGSRNH